ncbi:hypothetical protein QM797_08090 [Rhodococcus sp. IEGM 1381]|uniref:hypothetical protein n=1 Tax=Rhodococcus sp. IEGM 1381 TaxID=3047085 RepID=UPI0024B78D2C|nr:hypothetical protein [Rhodococcus sp. IEGM 1381]MDI9894684.1 hypothetical protein [Rhodococcus sp. IEGM 1381]
MYHWRILSDSAPEGFVDEFGGLERAVTYWEGSPAIRSRLEAIGTCKHSVVVFLEHIPHTLGEWIAQQRNSSDGEAVFLWAENAPAQVTEFTSAHGFVHFDAHFANILTDGQQLYCADFGLASSSIFDLSTHEATFLSHHLSYDRVYTAGQLLRMLVADKFSESERDALPQSWIEGTRPEGMSPAIEAFVDRHIRPTTVLNSFHRSLVDDTEVTPFPRAEIDRG